MYLISKDGNRIVNDKEAKSIMSKQVNGFVITGLEKSGIAYEKNEAYENINQLEGAAARYKMLGYKVYTSMDKTSQVDLMETVEDIKTNGKKKKNTRTTKARNS